MSALADSSKLWHIVLRCTICGPVGLLFYPWFFLPRILIEVVQISIIYPTEKEKFFQTMFPLYRFTSPLLLYILTSSGHLLVWSRIKGEQCLTKNLPVFHWIILTMVTYFLRWTLLKFFSSFPNEQSQQKVRHLDRITCAVINTSNEVRARYCGNFKFIIFLWEFLKGSLVGSIVNIRNECLFSVFMGNES